MKKKHRKPKIPVTKHCKAKLLIKTDLIESYSFTPLISGIKSMVTFFKDGEIPDPVRVPAGVMQFESGTVGFEHPFICKMIDGMPRIMVIMNDKSNELAYNIVDTIPVHCTVERPIRNESIGMHQIQVPGPCTTNIHVNCLFNGFPTLLKLSYTSIL